MFFVQVIGRPDSVKAFSQLASRVGLYVEGYAWLRRFEPNQHEPFAMYAERKPVAGKQVFGNFRVKRQDIGADFFYIHKPIGMLRAATRAIV